MKCKSWWYGEINKLPTKSWSEQQENKRLYKNDYKCALFVHSLSWTLSIMLPLAYFINFNLNIEYNLLLVFNILTHMFIDNLKANKLKINLITDQSIHLIQIITTWYVLIGRF
ncbi:MAG: DUF3307 domain-containing protein [Herbinix sp.]|nr:DUF3307 domain-containing protein [Herbinix sp.]